MNSRHPDHPRYRSKAHAESLRKIGNMPIPTTLPCCVHEYNKFGGLVGRTFNVGARANVGGDHYVVVPTRKREGKDWVTTGARIERAFK